MEEKELPDKLPKPEKLLEEIKPPVKKSKFKGYILKLLKLFVGICLLPIVYAVSVCFSRGLLKLEPQVLKDFVGGMTTFLVVYLFIWEPAFFFKKGQRILEAVFRFFSPLVKVAPFVLPIYTILIFVAYMVAMPFVDERKYLSGFVFWLGFSLTLHIIFCAKTLRSRQGDSLKANYLFGFSLIYIIDVVLVAFFFNLIFQDFSFLNFFNGSYQITKDVYSSVFRQLFL